jgi:hypothetical protein
MENRAYEVVVSLAAAVKDSQGMAETVSVHAVLLARKVKESNKKNKGKELVAREAET